MWSDEDDTEAGIVEELREFWQQNKSRKTTATAAAAYNSRRPERRNDTERHVPTDGSDNSLFTVFVARLPVNTNKIELDELLGRCGPINKGATFMKHGVGTSPLTSYGFIRFLHKEHAEAAVREFNDFVYRGHKLRVEMARKPCRSYVPAGRSTRSMNPFGSNSGKLFEQDDDMLIHLIEAYSLLLAQPTDGCQLPDLSEFLNTVTRQPYKLQPAFIDTDYEITANLQDIHKDVVQSFVANMDHSKIKKIRENQIPIAPVGESRVVYEKRPELDNLYYHDYEAVDDELAGEDDLMTGAQSSNPLTNGHIMTTIFTGEQGLEVVSEQIIGSFTEVEDGFDVDWHENENGNIPQVLSLGVGRGRPLNSTD